MSVDMSIDYDSVESIHATSEVTFYLLEHVPKSFMASQYEAFAKQGLQEELFGMVIRVTQNDPSGRNQKKRGRGTANNKR